MSDQLRYERMLKWFTTPKDLRAIADLMEEQYKKNPHSPTGYCTMIPDQHGVELVIHCHRTKHRKDIEGCDHNWIGEVGGNTVYCTKCEAIKK